MKEIIFVIILFALMACGPSPTSKNCNLQKGDIVEVKISGKKGMVIKICGACDCRYLVRFHSGGDDYFKEYFRDFELVNDEYAVETSKGIY